MLSKRMVFPSSKILLRAVVASYGILEEGNYSTLIMHCSYTWEQGTMGKRESDRVYAQILIT